MVAGQDAEAAGVLRQHRGDAELGREVARSRAGASSPARRWYQRSRGRGRRSRSALRRRRAGRGSRSSAASSSSRSGRTSPSRRTGSWPTGSHTSGSTAREDVLRRRVPGPPQVAGEVAERGERLGQDRADGEATDGTHAVDGSDLLWIVPTRRCEHRDRNRARRRRSGRVCAVLAWPRGVRKGCEHGRTHPRHGRHARWSTSDASRRRPPRARPSPSRATVFREGHDGLGAEVVLTGARRRGAPAGADDQRRRGPRPLRRVGHARRRGRLDLRGARLVRPDRHLAARGRAQDPGRRRRRADVHRGRAAARAGRWPTADRRRPRAARSLEGAELRRDRTTRARSRPGSPRCRHPSCWPSSRRHPLRELVTVEGPYPAVRRPAARAVRLSWYEFFPRSEGATRRREDRARSSAGTFRTAAKRLDAVAAMGFDVIYLPPIHPIGEVNRKGPNNTLDPGPDDPGSPWAIGSTRRRPRRDPPRPRHPRRLRRVRGAAPASSASRSRSTSPCSARPTTRG